MSGLSQTIDALLEKRTVYVGILYKFDFVSKPARFWNGPNLLRMADGSEWRGGGAVISLDVLSPAIGTTAQPATIKLSGVDPEITAQMVQNLDEAIERDVTVYAQFFGDGELGEQFQPLDAPVALGSWVSDQPTFDGSAGTQMTVSMSMESYFVGRSRSPNSYYSYEEQNDRAKAMGYPDGDSGGLFMTALQNKTVTFPDY